MRKIITNLWFDTQAEEAARFYTSLLEDSAITGMTRYDAAGAAVSGRSEGSVQTVAFTLMGQEYIAINGGPVFQFTPAVSLMVGCDTQEEIDRLWEAFCREGQESQCGWLTDKFGLSWQIVPARLEEWMRDASPEQLLRMNTAMFGMKKLVIGELLAALRGE